MIKETLARTENGHVFICPTCHMIHLEYKNLNYNFNDHGEYLHFANYILELDGDYWEDLNEDIIFKRKIIIPGGFYCFNILLDNEELDELKALFSGLEVKEDVVLQPSLDFFHES